MADLNVNDSTNNAEADIAEVRVRVRYIDHHSVLFSLGTSSILARITNTNPLDAADTLTSPRPY